MRFVRFFCLLTSVCCSVLAVTPASAGEARVIELTDGSLIQGEVLSLQGGIYKVRTESFGTVEIAEEKIVTIQKKPPCRRCGKSEQHPDLSNRQLLQDLQSTLMNDQEIMKLILSLQQDPEFRKIVQDPKVMQSLLAGDVSALMKNPDFMKLLDNDTIRDIQGRISEKGLPPQ